MHTQTTLAPRSCINVSLPGFKVTGREGFRRTTGQWRDSRDAGLGTGGDLHLIFLLPEERCNAYSCNPAWCASLRDKAELCSTELHKINPLTAGAVQASVLRKLKKRESGGGLIGGGGGRWCSSLPWVLSVFQLLHIWPLAAWTLWAAEQRKWLPKWLGLLWVPVVQPGVSPQSADSWSGQATYHLQI